MDQNGLRLALLLQTLPPLAGTWKLYTMICAEVTLSVWADNPDAVAFYRHLGMRVQEYAFEDIL